MVDMRRGILAVLGTLVAVMALVLGGGLAPAHAADALNPGDTGSLTIHKYENPAARPGSEPARDGTEITDPVGTYGWVPISGVPFTVERISNVDLSTNPGWETAAKLTIGGSGAVTNTGDGGWTPTYAAAVGPQNTNGSGETTFAGLPIGVYRVTEGTPPAGVTPAAPFLVTIPVTDPANPSQWITHVHAYPKNSKITATKTVQTGPTTHLKQEIGWIITGDIPRDDTIAGYVITDTLDSRLTDISVAHVRLTEGSGSELPLTAGTHYTVGQAGQVVTMTFTPTGLTALQNRWKTNPTSKVEAKLVTTVTTHLGGATPGTITNAATITPGGGTTITTGEPVVKYGNVNITKQDATNAATKLAGAQFRIYPELADAQANNGNYLTFDGGTSSWITDADGLVSIDGLLIGSKDPGAADPGPKTYYLVEITAPTGYQLLAQPVPVTFTWDNGTALIEMDVTIENAKRFELPLTGGSGTLALMIGGGLVLALVLAVAIRRRRTTR